ncbi:flagellar hook-basal body complex protein FliE [Rheinheimera sp. UJ51]|uniref:flagellar hook-basal body complex protein FliE n=1 Tax=unclassified Rheinheimera TaxID=115860 RepID=UPI001E58B05C|nr:MULTISPECIES: flagellar hook-basal body complex protein FliE [unclassified Rheinheimera]MCC5450467.1 flagellar hook-basal body complex protein FliE [Rheinheimera sp. UJ51]MCF4009096.1 flagellar hook-basal body complex protein FliE [Rheinheimera sp. UJ63]
MEIKGQALYAQMQSMATQARALPFEADPSMAVQPTNSSQSDFSTLFKNALGSVNELQQQSRGMATAVEMGDPKVSLAQAMIAAQKSSLAFEATVQVRNKVVEAYKEIMSMPV